MTPVVGRRPTIPGLSRIHEAAGFSRRSFTRVRSGYRPDRMRGQVSENPIEKYWTKNRTLLGAFMTLCLR